MARRLGRQFYDSDHEIEARTGVRIPVIFEHEGEDGFRQREAQTIDELTQRSGIVLATGGGAVLRAENRERIKTRGTVVYLRANPHDLWLRTRRDKNRPLLQTADPRARLERLFQERDALYRECATFVIETGRPSVNALVNMVLMQLEMAGIVPNLPEHSQTAHEVNEAQDAQRAGQVAAAGSADTSHVADLATEATNPAGEVRDPMHPTGHDDIGNTPVPPSRDTFPR
ncbi:Shikimate kinase 1 [Pandoraea morbifera]|uniref:Shikimate kinase n=1 Tax=Pandoraea morbifera TaxID=2508300 RepID=A0A5E4X9V2_9BURK|nr:Shikimate kinase 1 [Pandoraea morbifera]